MLFQLGRDGDAGIALKSVEPDLLPQELAGRFGELQKALAGK